MVKKGFLVIIAMVLGLSVDGWARRDIGLNRSAQVELDLRLKIAVFLFLQIGSPGRVVNMVRFNVTDIPENQPLVEGDFSPTIKIKSNVGKFASISLTVDSSNPLMGKSAKMPLKVISFEGIGDFSGIKGTLDGSPNQKIASFPGKSKKQGSFRFFYHNTYNYPPDIYRGSITFTLSFP